jgi:uncharacterized protein
MSGPEDSKQGDPKLSKAAKSAACPVCGKPAAAGFRPFCSDRCRMVDLNRWLSEAYRIPASEPDQNGENQSESED